MLQLIQQRVQNSIERSMSPGEERTELLEAHDLVIHDEPKFNGATSHEVRDHFHGWVAEQLPKVVDTPETLQRILESHSEKKRELPGPEYGFGARFNLALFVDDICLESLDHMDDPVVKIMYKQWGDLSPEERNYEIDPEWHDGTQRMRSRRMLAGCTCLSRTTFQRMTGLRGLTWHYGMMNIFGLLR